MAAARGDTAPSHPALPAAQRGGPKAPPQDGGPGPRGVGPTRGPPRRLCGAQGPAPDSGCPPLAEAPPRDAPTRETSLAPHGSAQGGRGSAAGLAVPTAGARSVAFPGRPAPRPPPPPPIPAWPLPDTPRDVWGAGRGSGDSGGGRGWGVADWGRGGGAGGVAWAWRGVAPGRVPTPQPGATRRPVTSARAGLSPPRARGPGTFVSPRDGGSASRPRAPWSREREMRPTAPEDGAGPGPERHPEKLRHSRGPLACAQSRAGAQWSPHCPARPGSKAGPARAVHVCGRHKGEPMV